MKTVLYVTTVMNREFCENRKFFIGTMTTNFSRNTCTTRQIFCVECCPWNIIDTIHTV